MRRNSVLSSFLIILLSLPLPAIAQETIDRCEKIQVPGSYVVTRDLPYTDGLLTFGDCLKITVSGVSIDLAGYTITVTNEAVEGRAGVHANVGLQHISVTGGTIVGFWNGVDFGGSDNVTVHGMRLLNNANQGIIVGNESVVTENVVSNLDMPEDTGVGITAGFGSRVIDNLVSNTTLFGISVQEESIVHANLVRLTEAPFGGDAAGIKAVCPSKVTDNSVTRTAGGEPGGPPDIDLFEVAAGLGNYNSGLCFYLNNAGNVMADNGPGGGPLE